MITIAFRKSIGFSVFIAHLLILCGWTIIDFLSFKVRKMIFEKK